MELKYIVLEGRKFATSLISNNENLNYLSMNMTLDINRNEGDYEFIKELSLKGCAVGISLIYDKGGVSQGNGYIIIEGATPDNVSIFIMSPLPMLRCL